MKPPCASTSAGRWPIAWHNGQPESVSPKRPMGWEKRSNAAWPRICRSTRSCTPWRVIVHQACWPMSPIDMLTTRARTPSDNPADLASAVAGCALFPSLDAFTEHIATLERFRTLALSPPCSAGHDPQSQRTPKSDRVHSGRCRRGVTTDPSGHGYRGRTAHLLRGDHTRQRSPDRQCPAPDRWHGHARLPLHCRKSVPTALLPHATPHCCLSRSPVTDRGSPVVRPITERATRLAPFCPIQRAHRQPMCEVQGDAASVVVASRRATPNRSPHDDVTMGTASHGSLYVAA